MSLFEHDDNAIGQTEAISNIYATVIPSNSIPARPTNVLFVRFILILRQNGYEKRPPNSDQCFIQSDHHSQRGAQPDVKYTVQQNLRKFTDKAQLNGTGRLLVSGFTSKYAEIGDLKTSPLPYSNPNYDPTYPN